MNESLREHENENTDETTPRASARRAKRSKRTLSRSPSLKRKKPAKVEKAAPAAEAKEEKAEEKEAKPAPSRRPRRRRPAAARTSKKKKAAPAAKPAAKTRKEKTEEEEYELRSLPDGTQYRVKISAKKKTTRQRITRKRGARDTGPGPAIVDLAAVEPLQAKQKKEINLGFLKRETRRAANFLKRNLTQVPEVAVVLGSGLSSVADIVDEEPVSFADVPGFMEPRAPGHPGLIRSGMVEGVPTLFAEGRVHYYESGSMLDVVHPIQTFLALGVERVILTTSAGALNPSYRVGDVVFIKDHINLMGDNPLFGMDPQVEPSVFVDMAELYDRTVLDVVERVCRRARVRGHEGVLAAVRGPVYETPAEKKWLRSMGADAVCMSIAPEAMAAAQVGASVTALALIVNEAKENGGPVEHEDVVKEAERRASDMKRLITSIIAQEW